MDSFDDMDIEEMLNNPLKNIDVNGNSFISVDPQQKRIDSKKAQASKTPMQKPVSKADLERMEKNHPIDHRVHSLEKNIINTDKKLETLKTIIEHQNERISKIEEELDLLRKHFGNNSKNIEDSPEK
ncbi:MAG: hypothetical protein HOC71_06435 [Candidatus Latescibacteria bacterium]|jgi:uncharacterized coiled-coil protein SlyX|nr:hypothetical protein [Candidatus Latescibacterota bacterium]